MAFKIKRMNERIKQLWLDALRSGEYKQAQGGLKEILGSGEVGFCCLGVLCDLYVKEDLGEWESGGWLKTDDERRAAYLPMKVMEWAGLEYDFGWGPDISGVGGLADMNDSGDSFKEIANKIEEEL